MRNSITYTLLIVTVLLMVAGCVEKKQEPVKPDYNGMYCDCVMAAHDINSAELSYMASVAKKQIDALGTRNTIYKDSQPIIDSFERAHRAKLKECDSLVKLY